MGIKLIPTQIDIYFLYIFMIKTFLKPLLFFFTKSLSFFIFNFFFFLDSVIDSFLFGLIKGYKVYIELKGAGYKFKIVYSNKCFGVSIKISYSHLIFILLPINFRIFFYNKTNICLYTNNLWKLHNQMHILSFQKKIDVYKGKGIYWKNKTITLKKNQKAKF